MSHLSQAGPVLVLHTFIILGETPLAKTFSPATALAMVIVDTVCLGGLLGAHVEAEVVVVAGALHVGGAGADAKQKGDQEK